MKSMQIKPDMLLDELAEHIWVNGDLPDNWRPVATAMRGLLVRHAAAYQWSRVLDVEDVDWIRLRSEAYEQAGMPAR